MKRKLSNQLDEIGQMCRRPVRFLSMLSLVLIIIFGCVSNAYSGGPFLVDDEDLSGEALQWKDNKIVWHYDEGDLCSKVSNAEFVEWVRDGLDAWTGAMLPDPEDYLNESIAPIALTHEEGGGLGEDITPANLEDQYYLSDKQAIIITDEDGTIMEGLEFDPYLTLGITLPYEVTDKKITRGIVIMNGLMVSELGNDSEAEALVEASLRHELGHLANLDHAQVNLDLSEDDVCELLGSCPGGQYLTTMFPVLKSDMQLTLSRDDKITLAWIYPESNFSQYCTFMVEVLDKNSLPLQGVNVIARRATGTQMPRIDARSMVSGVLYPACTSDGHAFLHGIIPGLSYNVTYEPLSEEYTGASGFEPLPAPPSGFSAGSITYDGSTAIKCDDPGSIIDLGTVTIDVERPSAADQGCSGWVEPSGEPSAAGTSSGDSSGKSSKCSLVADAGSRDLPFMILLVFVAITPLLILRRYRVKRRSCRIF